MGDFSDPYLKQDYIYSTILHCMTIVEVPLHLFSAFLIWFHTPIKMRSIKITLMILHFWSAFLDITISSLVTPVVMFPAAMGYPMGILKTIGIPFSFQIYFLTSLCGTIGALFTATFENRYFQLVKYNNDGVLDSRLRTFIAVFNYLIAFTFVLPTTYSSPGTDVGIRFYKETLPLIPQELYQRPYLYILHLDRRLPMYSMFFAMIFYSLQIISYFLLTTFYLFSEKINISNRTLHFQRKFFIAICLQLAVPVVLLLIPIFYIIFSFNFQYFNHDLNLLCFIIIATHGSVAAILMILIHCSYRNATCNIIQKIFVPSTPVLITFNGFGRRYTF